MSWTPLFTGSEAARCWQAIDDVAGALDSCPTSPADFGPTVLLAYLAMHRDSSEHLVRAEARLERAGDALATGALAPGLYYGLAGVGWVCAHFDALFERPDQGAYDELDQALLEVAQDGPQAGYELVRGTVGIGVYFLERLPSPRAAQALEAIVGALGRSAEASADACTWFTPPAALTPWQREEASAGFYNLGVAHGVPAVLGLLAEVHRAGIARPACEALLARAARWALRQRRDDGTLPRWVAPDARPARTRVAWCYGGLGASLGLLAAARALGDPSIERGAIDLALGSAGRDEAVDTRDAALCHGAAGNGHLFNRLFQATGLPELRRAAVRCFERALELRAGGGVGGFRGFRIAGEALASSWEDDPSFLTGASGIALALLSAVTEPAPGWDRVLLTRLSS